MAIAPEWQYQKTLPKSTCFFGWDSAKVRTRVWNRNYFQKFLEGIMGFQWDMGRFYKRWNNHFADKSVLQHTGSDQNNRDKEMGFWRHHCWTWRNPLTFSGNLHCCCVWICGTVAKVNCSLVYIVFKHQSSNPSIAKTFVVTIPQHTKYYYHAP